MDLVNHVDGVDYCNVCDHCITQDKCDCEWRKEIEDLRSARTELIRSVRVEIGGHQSTMDEVTRLQEKLKAKNKGLKELCYCDEINNLHTCKACKYRNGE